MGGLCALAGAPLARWRGRRRRAFYACRLERLAASLCGTGIAAWRMTLCGALLRVRGWPRWRGNLAHLRPYAATKMGGEQNMTSAQRCQYACIHALDFMCRRCFRAASLRRETGSTGHQRLAAGHRQEPAGGGPLHPISAIYLHISRRNAATILLYHGDGVAWCVARKTNAACLLFWCACLGMPLLREDNLLLLTHFRRIILCPLLRAPRMAGGALSTRANLWFIACAARAAAALRLRLFILREALVSPPVLAALGKSDVVKKRLARRRAAGGGGALSACLTISRR